MVFGIHIFKKKYYNEFKKELNYKLTIEYVKQVNYSTNKIHDDRTLIDITKIKESINKNGKFILCNINVLFLPYTTLDNGRTSNIEKFFKTPTKVYPIIVEKLRNENEISLFDGHTRSKVAREKGILYILGYVPEKIVNKYDCFTKI